MLTLKQQRFVEEYLRDLNAKAAYIRAGYGSKGHAAESAASRLLSNVEVSSAIEKAINKRAEKAGLSAELVIRGIMETIERCRQAVPVLNRKGEPVLVETPTGELAPAYTFEAMATLKGYELLGRHLGMFTDKTEVSGPGGGAIPVLNVLIG